MQFDTVLLSLFYNIFYEMCALTTFFLTISYKNKDILVYLM